ncbi:MAG TPA: FliM/FliN family flagellar motor switch protein [Bryobacteraceae bacterium]|nr:FliM/FliN family flagellar motor switch protein [Bryobacteraceae bacterium]
MKRELSQQEIDALFNSSGTPNAGQEQSAIPYDFARLDRIPKSQMRAIHQLHENFVRGLASTLSVYLRSYVRLNLVSLEQIAYSEFLAELNSPTCIAYANIAPYNSTAVIEVSPSVAACVIEVLLGGSGTTPVVNGRKMTDIEKSLITGFLKVVLNDLSEAWRAVTDVRYDVRSVSTEPEMFQVIAPTEAVIAITIDVSIGQSSGLLTFAIPSIFVKRLRNNFEHVREATRTKSSERDQKRIAGLLDEVMVHLEVKVEAGSLNAQTLVGMGVGDIIRFDCPVTQQPVAVVNDAMKFTGSLVQKNEMLLYSVAGPTPESQRTQNTN